MPASGPGCSPESSRSGLESLHVKSCRNLRQERARGRRRKARAWHAGSLLYRVWRKNRARSLAKNANAVRCAGQKLLHTHPQLSSMKSFRLSTSRGWPITTPEASTGHGKSKAIECRAPMAGLTGLELGPASFGAQATRTHPFVTNFSSEKSPGGRQTKGWKRLLRRWERSGHGSPPPTPLPPPPPPPRVSRL